MRNPLRAAPDVMGFNTGTERRTGRNGPVLWHLTAIALAAMAGGIVRHCLSGCSRGVTGLKLSGFDYHRYRRIRAMLVAFNTASVAGVAGNGAPAAIRRRVAQRGLTWAKTAFGAADYCSRC